jgi:hypothetical protein
MEVKSLQVASMTKTWYTGKIGTGQDEQLHYSTSVLTLIEASVWYVPFWIRQATSKTISSTCRDLKGLIYVHVPRLTAGEIFFALIDQDVCKADRALNWCREAPWYYALADWDVPNVRFLRKRLDSAYIRKVTQGTKFVRPTCEALTGVGKIQTGQHSAYLSPDLVLKLRFRVKQDQ